MPLEEEIQSRAFVVGGRLGWVAELPCGLQFVRSAVEAACRWLEEMGLPKEDVEPWMAVLPEALNNAIEYAPEPARSLPVRLDMRLGEKAVEAAVWDHTPGFEWPAEPPSLPPPESEGGRGLYIIFSMTDEAGYLRGREGNLLVLRRKRARPGPLPEGSSPENQRRIEEDRTALEEMTEELALTYEALSLLYQYGPAIVAGEGLSELIRTLIERLAELTRSDLVVFRLLDENRKILNVSAVYPTELQGRIRAIEPDKTPKSIEWVAFDTLQDQWIEADSLREDDPLRSAGITPKTGFCHAVRGKENKPLGSVLMARKTAEEYVAREVQLLNTIFDFIGIQIANRRLIEEQTRMRLAERELEIAAQAQRSMLPHQLHQCPPFSIAAYCQSARKAGGDFYDVIGCRQGGELIVLSDVMGKGIAAAMFAVVMRTAVRTLSAYFSRPGRLLSHVNRVLCADFERADYFTTAALAYLQPADGKLAYAVAGHPPMLIWDPIEGRARDFGRPDLPIGIQQDVAYEDFQLEFAPGMLALLYTDGVTEARNKAGEFFGDERLKEWMTLAGPEIDCAQTAVALLRSTLEEFGAGASLADDQTFLFIHRAKGA
ncbi:MAG: SpoIIE family protein phosphatase [Verrucomicrobia bacterium]|nr:SpoIIE family protein phosphatase [Verrucomicrobiota bacterium]